MFCITLKIKKFQGVPNTDEFSKVSIKKIEIARAGSLLSDFYILKKISLKAMEGRTLPCVGVTEDKRPCLFVCFFFFLKHQSWPLEPWLTLVKFFLLIYFPVQNSSRQKACWIWSTAWGKTSLLLKMRWKNSSLNWFHNLHW